MGIKVLEVISPRRGNLLVQPPPVKHKKRVMTTQTALAATPEMVFISQPTTVPLIEDLADNYVYDDSAGLGQVIYSLDFGAATSHPVSYPLLYHVANLTCCF